MGFIEGERKEDGQRKKQRPAQLWRRREGERERERERERGCDSCNPRISFQHVKNKYGGEIKKSRGNSRPVAIFARVPTWQSTLDPNLSRGLRDKQQCLGNMLRS